MHPFNITLILSMREAYHYLIHCHELSPEQARELIELVVMAQWSSIHHRQITRVYDMGHGGLLDALDFLDEALFDFCADFTQPERFARMRRAARTILIDVEPHTEVWAEFSSVDVTRCRLVWRKSDLLIRVH